MRNLDPIKIVTLKSVEAPESQETDSVESAGRRLQQERKAQKISEKEAAHALRVMVTDLRAIESDSYNAMPHDEQLRVYLRDYANFLHLDADLILAIYDRQAGTNFHRGVHRIADIPPREAETKWASLVTGSLMVATAVLGFLVVVQFADKTTVDGLLVRTGQSSEGVGTVDDIIKSGEAAVVDPSSAQSAVQGTLTLASESSNESAADVVADKEVAGRAGAQSPDLVATNSGAPTESRRPNVEVTVATANEAASPEQPEAIAVAPKPRRATDADDSKLVNQESPVKALPVEESPVEVPAVFQDDADLAAAPVSTTDTLSFEFSKDCWVEVYDADDKRLVAKVEKAGEPLKVEGVSPFRVLVGYSRATRLQFNGHPVDIERIDRSYSTLFRVERAPAEATLADAKPKVTTIRRDLSEPAN